MHVHITLILFILLSKIKEYLPKSLLSLCHSINSFSVISIVSGGNYRRLSICSYIGVIGIGYGDGYYRETKSGAPVLIGGIKYPMIYLYEIYRERFVTDQTSAVGYRPRVRLFLWTRLTQEIIQTLPSTKTY